MVAAMYLKFASLGSFLICLTHDLIEQEFLAAGGQLGKKNGVNADLYIWYVCKVCYKPA